MALNDPTDKTSLSYRFREKRDRFLRRFLLRNGGGGRRILDLGGTAHYWHRVGLDFLQDNGFEVTVVNLERNDLGEGPFKLLVGDATALAEGDNSYDIVHSNSVIEHVGGAEKIAAFARETRRLAPAHYMQTPNFWFPVDPHFWRMPVFHWLPESARIALLQKLPIATAGVLPDRENAKTAVEGTRLLTPKRVRQLFPESRIGYERFAALPKSIIAWRGA